MGNILSIIIISFLFFNCNTRSQKKPLQELVHDLPSLQGKKEYLSSPYVTAGNRVYMVGYQDGTFPDLGWHIAGEMGGIWDHPIKLLDGFKVVLSLNTGRDSFCLTNASVFINYPVGNLHIFNWQQQQIQVSRFQFVPDGEEGLEVEFIIRNDGKEERAISFSFTGMIDLRPVWLGEQTGMIDAPDSVWYDKDMFAMLGKDKKNDWYTIVGSPIKPDKNDTISKACYQERKGLGKDATLSYKISVPGNGGRVIIPFVIAGSYHSAESAKATYKKLIRQASSKLEEKIKRFQEIKNTADLKVPDSTIQTMFEWVKYNNDWLVREVPEVGRGLSAGLPDYPWWFGCDNTYALQGVLAIGQPEIVKSTLQLLHKISARTNGNGRIIHESSTNGAVYNPGNVNETAHFIYLLWQYYEWTGDKGFVSSLYPDVKKGLSWLLNERDPDGNLCPNGPGIMEIRGLNSEMIDVAVYTQQALECGSRLAAIMGDEENKKEFSDKAALLKRTINTQWWVEAAGSYADFISTKKIALPLISNAIVRADTLQKPWAVDELKAIQKKVQQLSPGKKIGHVVFHNWVVNTPMEMGIADADKAGKALSTARKFTNNFGVYVTGIDRPDSYWEKGMDSMVAVNRKKNFSYTGAVMTLPTGVQAISEARYGNPDSALHYLKLLSNSFSYALPGSLYEISPDFGMVVQAWTIYSVAVPVVNYFFGVQPSAYNKTVGLRPRLPQSWKSASLNNIKVGDNIVSIAIESSGHTKTYTLSQSREDWKLVLDIQEAKEVFVNGKKIAAEILRANPNLSLTGKKNIVVVKI
jgi:hypothetical protein